MTAAIEALYKPYDYEIYAFGEHWCGPENYQHAEDTLIAKYEKTSNDGQPVEVYCSAWPARFYIIKALKSPNGIGGSQASFVLTTGSGMEAEAVQIAKWIAGAMVGLQKEK